MEDINQMNTAVGQEFDEAAYQEAELYASRDSWLQIANNAYSSSTDYMNSSIRDQWERNLYNFHGRDKATNTKQNKAHIFRPKIRASIRSFEAALAVALFSNNDLARVSGADANNPVQESAAKLHQALLQHRLDQDIPWFATVIGAYQDTHNYGLCISKTHWRYEVRDVTETVAKQDEFGDFIVDEEGYAEAEERVIGQEVLSDKPVIDLLPPENFRFDPNADWRNPLVDSPYLIEQIPMYATDVMSRMKSIDEKTGAPEWHEYPLSKIISAGTGDLGGDITRQAREGDRTDPKDVSIRSEYTTVWVHFNIVKKDGIDYAFYTLGATVLLSDPVPLEDYYKLGRDTYTIGFSSLEAHRNYPAGSNELGEDLQKATNIIANQRIDNVRLALNKRYFIRRQGNVDLGALMRNVAGGGVMVDDPDKDVQVINTPDVTSSSYAEQDRINMDMDEILGTFSPSSVQSNRSLNETVGGMNLMSNGANQIQEYTMRIFMETWVEKVLNTLVKLEQLYETDENILMLAANKGGVKDELIQMAGSPQMLDRYIQQGMLVTVNVGMGNTNPEQKINRLMMAVNATAAIPDIAAKTDFEEVSKEVYAYAGYGDGERFIMTDEKMKKKMEEQGGGQDIPPEIQAEQMKQEMAMKLLESKQQHESAIKNMELQAEALRYQQENQVKFEIAMAQLAAQENKTLSELEARLGIESSKDKTNREIAAIKSQTANREMNIKLEKGSGI